jgi:hypothetical protein
MKRFIAGIIFTLGAALAFAMPKPSDIEGAIQAQKYNDAKSMISEVLREKPDSARAHLLNAYVLIHADHNKVAANTELENAVRLDNKGDVKSSALFGRTVAEIDLQQVKVQPFQTNQVISPANIPLEPVHKRFFNFLLFLTSITILFFGIVAVAIHFFRKSDKAELPKYTPQFRDDCHTFGASSSGLSRNNFVSPAPVAQPQQYYPQPVQTFQPAPQQGMGMMGTAASVAGGVVAGELLADALHHRSRLEEHNRTTDTYTPAPAYEPSPVSYSNESSSYSSGSSDSWGSSDSSSSSSSDW